MQGLKGTAGFTNEGLSGLRGFKNDRESVGHWGARGGQASSADRKLERTEDFRGAEKP